MAFDYNENKVKTLRHNPKMLAQASRLTEMEYL